MCDISTESIRHICTREDGGNVAVIVVGGASESLDARPGSCKITLKRRKGFIRMALLTGYVFVIFTSSWSKKTTREIVKALYPASVLLTLDKSRRSGAQLGGGRGGRPPLYFFENQKKCPDFGKNCPDAVHP